MPAEVLDDMESSAGLHLRRAGAAERTALPHADDRRGQSPPHAPRPHGQHHAGDHDAGHARGLPRRRPPQPERARTRQRPPYVRATTAAGTDILAELNPELQWFKTSGIISPEKWGNLPGGECFTAPGEVNGVFVVDGVVGDFLCAALRHPRRDSAHHHHRKNRIVACTSSNSQLQDDFWEYTHATKTPTAWASLPSAPTSASRA